MKNLTEHRIHEIFQISVLLKGAHAVLECASGVALAFASTSSIVNAMAWFKGARIVFNHGASSISCIIRDLSADGGKIVVESVIGIPNECELVFDDGTQTGSVHCNGNRKKRWAFALLSGS